MKTTPRHDDNEGPELVPWPVVTEIYNRTHGTNLTRQAIHQSHQKAMQKLRRALRREMRNAEQELCSEMGRHADV